MKVIMEDVIDARNNYTGDFHRVCLLFLGKPKACY